MKSKIKFYLGLFSDSVTPSEITEELGITPTSFWLKDHSYENREGKHDEHHWCLATDYEESLDIAIQIKKIYTQLLPIKDKLKKLLKDKDIEAIFEAVIEMSGEQTPAIYLEKYIVDFASEVGIAFDFDTYII